MREKIILISCVSQKLPHRAKAKDLYVSTLFRLNLKYANSLNPSAIYVLSAKHGLLELEREIEPYEQTLNNMRTAEIKQWANKVLQQLASVASLEDAEFIFLAGNRYRKHLLPHIKNSVAPLEGLRIGEQLQRLKELTA
jgi:glycerophosphoryl diester phosphodiesterase